MSLPLSAFGGVAMGAILGPAILLYLVSGFKQKPFADILSGCRTPLGVALLTLFSWWFLTSLLSYEPAKSIKAFLRTGLFVFICYEICRQSMQDKRLLDLALKAFIASSICVLGYIAVIHYVNQGALELYAYFRSSETKPGSIFKAFGSAAACFVPIYIWSGCKLSRSWRICSFLLVPIAIAVIWQNGLNSSRSAILGLAGSLAAIAFLYLLIRIPRRALPYLLCLLVPTAVIGFTYFLSLVPHFPFDGHRLQEIALPIPDPYRQVIWGAAADIIAGNPIMGVGLDSVNLLPYSQQHIEIMTDYGAIKSVELIPSHPHNWILEISAESGLVGISILLVTLLLLAKQIWPACLTGTPAGWAAIGLNGAFWISALTNFSIWASWWQATYLILLALVMSDILSSRQEMAQPSTGETR